MTFNKRKKNSRMRGSKTHGWGSKKKHRGSGNRGGFGMAGTGKKSDHRKFQILKLDYEYFGKRGFNRPRKVIKDLKIINIDGLSSFNEETIDLREKGYDKLLGKGKINKKVNVIVDMFSAVAKQKIERAGGQILTE